ncbi:nitrate- and nitrite sensing domain-containing protein [Dactylosporangium roseum]|uniref:histidine kinase n=1 Tax=Dactylosporangium roseum TaxID=47989 RepID=A0ABY5Z4N9_9ACTN|nr:nitrate- and nitrite sensing domain-containing protein [Dactylosporangium roseum]UWZ36000.1 nitrate- and nitrite sensing domain-containing protein [Dactylosporangium roseum]
MRDWRVPTKLAAVLVLPAVAFLVIAGVQINASVQDASKLDQFAQGVKVGRQLTDLIHQLQLERDRTAGVLAKSTAAAPGGSTSNSQELAVDYAQTDAALAAFSKAARPLAQNPMFGQTQDRVTADFQDLALVREGVKSRWLREEAVFDLYSTTIQHLFDLVPDRPDIGGDSQSVGEISSLLDLAEAKELKDQLRGRIFAATSAGKFSPDDFETFSEIQARQVAAVERFRSSASPRHLALYDRNLRQSAVSAVARLQQQIIARAQGAAVGVTPEEWWLASTSELEYIRTIEMELLEDAIEGAAQRSTDERNAAFLATSAIVLVMLLALLLSWLIGRSMARSLRQLRAQALDVAQHRLPEAIQRLRTLPRGETVTVDTTTRVRSSDEIGEVADAFTAVHRSAVSLAVEQAVMRRNVNSMFVNLARRSQTLVERQLQLLDQLESAETDPDQLANLFRLDHLATRMRRNDENLLVLAGSEATRRWAQPVSLSAVTLAAMAEIEQYARIRHDVSNDVHIVGHAVADVVHLLAELLENATTFSPPDTVVTVSGWPGQGTKDATIVIEDKGIGMTEAGLVDANERVSTPIAIDVAASERMGLVVVGHLADRHGVHVHLTATDEGVTAFVTLPAKLLAAPPEDAGLYGGAGNRLSGPGRLPIAVEDIARPPLPSAPSAAGSPTPVAPALPGRPVPAGAETDEPRPAADVPAVAAPPLPGVPVVTTTWPVASSAHASPDRPLSDAPASAQPVSGTLASAQPVSGAPASARPVSAAPLSAVPVSAEPVSAAPVSAVPVSAAPVSAAPAASAPVAGAPNPEDRSPGASVPDTPVSGAPASGPPGQRSANGGPATAARRGPNRAEDIIGAATRGNAVPASKGTRWWSRGGAGDAPAAAPVIPTQRTPVTAGTSGAGLPIRVPLAQLPGDDTGPAPAPDVTQPLTISQHTEPDPASVSNMLTRFYSGVHRAANEDEVPTVPINDHRGSTA